jgi:hypothetical protein
MKSCIARLSSVSPYSQSRPHVTEELEKEGKDDYEKRTWKEKAHVDSDDLVFIPGPAFKKSTDSAAAFLALKIPGRGKALYTKHFLAGVLVAENFSLGVKKADIEGEWVFVDANGRRGSGTRVWRCFPLFREWEVDVTFHIADDTITKEVFEYVLGEAGKFIGIGRWRAQVGGTYGRFAVEEIVWQ